MNSKAIEIVRGMFVRGMLLIPLTIIPLTICSCSSSGHERTLHYRVPQFRYEQHVPQYSHDPLTTTPHSAVRTPQSFAVALPDGNKRSQFYRVRARDSAGRLSGWASTGTGPMRAALPGQVIVLWDYPSDALAGITFEVWSSPDLRIWSQRTNLSAQTISAFQNFSISAF